MAMGARSRLVLEKLGFDMRPAYEDLVREPPPPKVAELLEKLASDEVETSAPEKKAPVARFTDCWSRQCSGRHTGHFRVRHKAWLFFRSAYDAWKCTACGRET